MNRLWGWGLGAALALGLAACGDSPVENKRPLEPGGGFKAEAIGDVTATLKIPDTVSPSAALIQADLSLQNKASDVAVVTVPRACDVYDWVIRDTADKLVMTKDPVECAEQATTKALAPGSILTERVSIYLLPNVLKSGTRYVVEYRFWGQPATAAFTAHR